MTHSYMVTGITCAACQAKVQAALSKVAGVKKVAVDLKSGETTIEMDKHVATEILQGALKAYPAYQLSEARMPMPVSEEEKKSWWSTYKPIVLVFAYILLIAGMAAFSGHHFDINKGMRIFMAGFFIAFSFFKLLDLRGFADSYTLYDIIAKKFRGWAFVYAFTELGLGIAYAINFEPLLTNMVTLGVMGVSLVGVVQSVMHKRKIKCACLGAVFNLPMSTVTIFEDTLMIAMSISMMLIMPW